MGRGGLLVLALATLCGAATSGAASSTAFRPPAAPGLGLAEEALAEGLQQLSPAERDAFWAKLRRARDAREAALPPAEAPSAGVASRPVWRRAQEDDIVRGQCLGLPQPPSMARNPLTLTVEVNDGSDLNILASHVAKVLLEEVIGFGVNLKSMASNDGAMQRLALQPGQPDSTYGDPVDLNIGIMAEAKVNVELYNKLVAEENLVTDLGPSGYSVQAGWFTQDRLQQSSCDSPSYAMTYTDPTFLGDLTRADEIAPYALSHTTSQGVAGDYACNGTAGRGFCGPNGIYYSKMCDSVTGMSLADPTRPCRALIAHRK